MPGGKNTQVREAGMLTGIRGHMYRKKVLSMLIFNLIGHEPPFSHSAYPKCSSKAVLKVGGNAHEQGLAAGDHGHAGSQVSHHMVGSHTHTGLL